VEDTRCLCIVIIHVVQDCELAELRLTVDKLTVNSASLQLAPSLSAGPAAAAAAHIIAATAAGLSVCLSVCLFAQPCYKSNKRLQKGYKSRRGGRKLPYSDRQLQVCAKNFNFAPKLPKMGDFQPQILYFATKIL